MLSRPLAWFSLFHHSSLLLPTPQAANSIVPFLKNGKADLRVPPWTGCDKACFLFCCWMEIQSTTKQHVVSGKARWHFTDIFTRNRKIVHMSWMQQFLIRAWLIYCGCSKITRKRIASLPGEVSEIHETGLLCTNGLLQSVVFTWSFVHLIEQAFT